MNQISQNNSACEQNAFYGPLKWKKAVIPCVVGVYHLHHTCPLYYNHALVQVVFKHRMFPSGEFCRLMELTFECYLSDEMELLITPKAI